VSHPHTMTQNLKINAKKMLATVTIVH
jgi:hypothetical protein